MRSLLRILSALGMGILSLAFLVQAQAKNFLIDEAEWDKDKHVLTVKGYGEPFSTVAVFIADSDENLASTTVSGHEHWRVRIYDPEQVPCVIFAISSGVEAVLKVSLAPVDCVDTIDTQQDGSSITNHPPTITGAPGTHAVTDEFYSFTPTASDPDGDQLQFVIFNLPDWADFYSSNGTLSGIPGTQDAGLYTDVIISVTDGSYTTSLGPADILVEVGMPQTGTIRLTWVAPATRTDGSDLDISEISGYKVYMGTTENNLTLLDDISDPTQTSYLVENLLTCTYFFAVTAYDQDKLESSYSTIVSKYVIP